MTTSKTWKLAGAALAVAAIAVAVTLTLMQPEPAPAPPADTVPANHDPARFGPGLLPSTQAEAPPPPDEAAALDPWVPAGLEVSSDQRLVVNKGLRLVFDYFLQPTVPGDRAERLEKLQAYLKAKLPASAYAEATPIASNYAKYLTAADALNAGDRDSAQNGAIPTSYAGIEQMKARIGELSRLRQSMLGIDVAHAWFAADETGLQQMLAKRGHTPKVVLPESSK